MITVLYVEDEPALVALFRRYLQEESGIDLRTAGSGPEALAVLDRHAVDVVVSDYAMPGMNGIELLRECRRRFDGLPFILFTGRVREEIPIVAIEYGADFYMEKGVDPTARFAELVQICRQAAGWRRAVEELRAAGEQNRQILDGSPAGIHLYELAPDGTLVFLGGNPAADEIRGIEHAVLIGRSIDEVFADLRGSEVPERYREVARTGRPWHADLVTYRDGRIAGAVEAWAYAIGQGRIAVQFIEIADRLALEENLRQQGRRWEEVFEHCGQPAMVLDPEQTILAVNRECERAIGLPSKEMVGRRCTEVFHGTNGAPEGCPFHRLLESEEPSGQAELALEALGGTYLVSCSPICSEDGRITRAVCLATRITDRVRREQELQREHDKAALISNVTRHDLGNRLMALQGYLRMAERGEVEPERRARYRRLVIEAAQSMEEILSFAADYERVGARTPEWQRIADVVRDALAEVPLNGVRLEIETGAREVLADPMLRKVFSNLIDNSVRYGEGVTRIRVWSHADGDSLIVVFEDDGVGIPRDEKELIFWKGYGKNTGLGLFLTAQILRITGIEIRETGTLGIGARFELRCPPGTWR